MVARKRYRIGRFFVALSIATGWLLGAGALSVFTTVWTDFGEPFWTAVSSAAGAAALSLFCLYVGHGSARYAVELAEHGVRMCSSPQWVPWSAIARLHERRVLNRLDLIDHSGRRVASLEYQLKDIDEALERVLVSTRIPYTGAEDLGEELRLDGAGLTVRGWEFLAWDTIEGARLGVRCAEWSNLELDVEVECVNDRFHWVRPPTADPFALVLRIREELRRRSGDRVACHRVGGTSSRHDPLQSRRSDAPRRGRFLSPESSAQGRKRPQTKKQPRR